MPVADAAVPSLLSRLRIRPGLWIDGAWLEDGIETLSVTNPATGSPVGDVPLAGPEHFRRAIDGAQKSFEAWRNEPNALRGIS